MIVYCDGSQYKNTLILSYGVLLHKGEEYPIEISGFHKIPRNMLSYHEEVAFVEALLLLKRENISYKNVSFYSDSENIINAGFWLEKNNYTSEKKVFIENIMKKVLNFLDQSDMLDEVLDCLKNSRFQKVKSHSKNTSIDNIRVDYLSKNAQKNERLSYQQFLACSFETFDKKGIPILSNLPFMPQDKTNKIRV